MYTIALSYAIVLQTAFHISKTTTDSKLSLSEESSDSEDSSDDDDDDDDDKLNN